jgi:hypothetical protein
VSAIALIVAARIRVFMLYQRPFVTIDVRGYGSLRSQGRQYPFRFTLTDPK